ncbi:MAG: S-layer homology domain-containing protein [Bacillota bacterium]
MRRFWLGIGLVIAFCLFLSQAAFAQFDDAPSVDSWVYESFRLVYDAGLIKGYPDGTFRGERPATRNEVVEFMARLMKYFEEKLAGVQAGSAEAEKALQAAQAAEAAAKAAQAAAEKAQAAESAGGVPEKEYLSKEEVVALIEEELAAREPGITQEDLDMLSEEIYEAIRDLEEQFIDELNALDVRVTTLEEKVEALENKDKEHEEAIAKLQADLETATKTIEEIKAQAAQDVAKAETEAKKAKSMGYVGAALGLIALLLAL